MSTLKCRKVGNSLGVILPTNIATQLRINDTSLLSSAIIDGALVIRPIPTYAKDFFDQSTEFMDELDDALRMLSDE